MPKIDLSTVTESNKSNYPSPYCDAVAGRWLRKLAPVAGIADFGANLCRLEPGAWSSQRHWHEEEDEILVMIDGEATLVDERGRTPLRRGDVAAFPKGDPNAHHMVNEGDRDCLFFVVGRVVSSACHYPDVDMALAAGASGFSHKDGTPY